MSIERVDVVRWSGVTSSSRDDAIVRVLRPAFPGLRVGLWDPRWWPRHAERVVSISTARWRSRDFDPCEIDGALAEAAATGSFVLRIEDDVPATPLDAQQVLTRAQRFVDLRNGASRGPVFDEVLARHRTLHDLTKPLVRADFEHAIDAWRWVLRLDPRAGAAVQIAALFHDIERLRTESDVRVEQHAADYQTFKDAHARAGAEITRECLSGCPLDAGVLDRAADLVARHERPGADPDLALLNDADGLSFFSLNASGFIRYFGVAHTRKKVAYTLRRMRPSARERLGGVRLRADIGAMVRTEQASIDEAVHESMADSVTDSVDAIARADVREQPREQESR